MIDGALLDALRARGFEAHAVALGSASARSRTRVLVGLVVQLLASSEAIAELSKSDLSARIALLAAGIALMGFRTGLYIGAGLGVGPRDSLMVAAARTRIRIGAVRGAIEAAALAVGFALGGTVGVGTLAFVILIGPAVEGSFWLLARSPLAEREATQTVLGPLARCQSALAAL